MSTYHEQINDPILLNPVAMWPNVYPLCVCALCAGYAIVKKNIIYDKTFLSNFQSNYLTFF